MLISGQYPGDPTLGGPGSHTHYWVTQLWPTTLAPPVSAAAAHTVAVHALTVRGIGLAWWEGARIPVARRADSHCTCCGSTQASVARSRITMSVPPLPTLALGRSSKHVLQRASRAARSARRLRHSHHQEATCASYRGSAHLGARARSAHAIGAERIARSADQAAAGARARSAHAIGAERVREAAMAAERLRLPRLAHRCAAPSAPSAEREAAIRLAAGARARSARAIGAPGHNRLHIAVSLEQHITVKLEQYKLGGYCLLAPLKKKGSPALALAHYYPETTYT